MHHKKYQLLDNSRFYILASTILLSIALLAWLRLSVDSDQLFAIRLEQTYGLVSILYWYLALIISPIGYAIGKQRIKHLEFGRRAIGVSAAYFAVLHMLVALWGQLGGPAEIGLLPNIFQWSLVGGFVAVIILLIMAATSFDKVIDYMTFARWKWLHRLVYLGGILAVLHIWAIGTHVSYSLVEITAFIALLILSALETFRVVKLVTKKYTEFRRKTDFITIFLAIWIPWAVFIFSIPSIVQNYHTQHHHDSSHTGAKS